MKNKIALFASSLALLSLPLPSIAGEIGVSHSVGSSVKSGTGQLTLESVTNTQVGEKSISFTGQLSGAEFEFLNGGASVAGLGEGGEEGFLGGNPALAVSGTLGSGGVDQLSASIAVRGLTATNKTKVNVVENYGFADSVFTQTSSTFSR